jgi:hypothetical protein
MNVVYIVGGIKGGNQSYVKMFTSAGWEVVGEDNAVADDTLSDIFKVEPDLVLFTGGADVSPELYKEEVHPRTGHFPKRDEVEGLIYLGCYGADLKMAGICRGGQFLNVMNGGGMYQDIDNHTREHIALILETGRFIPVSSTHHQMMIPGDGSVVKALAHESTRKEWMEGGDVITNTDEAMDVEVVLYPESGCLCFQPHPEMFSQGHPCTDYFFELIEELIECT